MISSLWLVLVSQKVLSSPILCRLLSCSTLLTFGYLQIKKALRGVKVEVTHRGNMRRKYRITGLTSQTTRDLMYVFLNLDDFIAVFLLLFFIFAVLMHKSYFVCLLINLFYFFCHVLLHKGFQLMGGVQWSQL